MDTHALMAHLREQTLLVRDGFPPSDCTDLATRKKLETRPYLHSLLRQALLQVACWRKSHPECAGLRKTHKNCVRPLSNRDLNEHFAKKPVDFSRAIAQGMLETMLISVSLLLNPLKTLGGDYAAVATTAKKRLQLEFRPGLRVVAGLIHASLVKQHVPELGRTSGIITRTAPLVRDWASQSQAGFMALEWALIDPDDKHETLWLSHPHRFVLVDEGTAKERLEFTPGAIANALELMPRLIQQRGKARFNCIGLEIEINDQNAIDDTVFWALEILRAQWPRMHIRGRRPDMR